MRLTLKEVQRLALIGSRLEIEMTNGTVRTGILTAIGHNSLSLEMETININTGDIKALRVLSVMPDRSSLEALINHGHTLVRYAKVKDVTLRVFFQDSIDHMLPRLEQSLLYEALRDKAFLAGSALRPDVQALLAELDGIGQILPEDKADLASALVYIAVKRMDKAMQVWLRHNGVQGKLDDGFVREYGLRLAATSASGVSRRASFVEATMSNARYDDYTEAKVKNVTLGRMPAFMFWASQLLRVDAKQLTENIDMWNRYLLQCVVFSYYQPLKEFMAACDEAFAYETLRSLFVLMDEYVWALQAERKAEPVQRLLLHLSENSLTYGIRFVRRVERLIEKNLLGRSNVGYVFEYSRSEQTGIIVSGCLHEIPFSAADQPALADLCDAMAQQFEHMLDYKPVLLSIGEDGKICPASGEEAREDDPTES